MPGQDAVRETENVPLSNSTINDMSHDAEEVLRDKLKKKTIQVDKSNRFH
jgi:hypothetical protein